MALFGASIDFTARRPVIHFSADEHDERRRWSVGFDLTLDDGWRQEVRLTTEEKQLSEVEGRLGFALMDEHTPEGEKGLLYYSEPYKDDFFGHPSRYSVTLWLTPEEHHRLVGLVQSGVPLTKVTVWTGDGVKYGWEPDGKGKDWDNAATPKVTVRGFTLLFGTDEDAVTEEVEAPTTILEEPGPRDTFKADVLVKLDDLRTRLMWIFGGIVALVAAALLARH